jgi:surfactin synthase thioesterase subunit
VTVIADRWFVTRVRRPRAPVQLFCLPYAGAGAGAYTAWPDALGIDVEVSALMLPGRERRMGEEPDVDPAEIASAVAERADRPYALFGHSMGARIGFEVARELRRAGAPMPIRLMVSACTPPDEPRDRGGRYDGLSELDDDEMIARLADGGGVPPEIMVEPELLELLRPAFRADLAWIDKYTFLGEPALPVPISAYAGDTDQAAPPVRMDGWRRQTIAGFTIRVIAGGHFFLHDRLADLAGHIRADLRAEEDRRGH